MTNTNKNEPSAVPQKPNKYSAAESNHIKCTVAVMSGKGGVGKSFVTGVLASALAKEGYQVGILDADITGPSIPMLFGLRGPVESGSVGLQPPKSASGIKIISMNLILPSEDQPIVWRGPLISQAIEELWGDVMWGDLDYLLIDLPPGTSDATLTIMHSLPVNGIVMVSTPQGLASMIVRKAVRMAQSIGVRIFGLVENMAYLQSSETGKKNFVFGPSHIEEVAKLANTPVLAQIPIEPGAAELCDMGQIEEIELTEMPAFLDAFITTAAAGPADIETSSANAPDGQQPQKSFFISDASEVGSQAVGGSTFSPEAIQLIQNQVNVGTLENPDVRGMVRGWCGDSIQIDLCLAGDIIQEARFLTDGCGATIACGGMITLMAQKKTLAEAGQITPEELKTALGGLPQGHEHCAELAVKTLCHVIELALKADEKKA